MVAKREGNDSRNYRAFCEVERGQKMKQITKKSNKRGVGKFLRITSALIFAAAMLAGCNKETPDTPVISMDSQSETKDDTVQTIAENNHAMGRYVESEISFPQEGFGGDHTGLVTMEDGSYEIVSAVGEKVSSTDQGETWTSGNLDWLSKLYNERYVASISRSRQGEYILVRIEFSENDDESAVSDYVVEYLYIDADGKQTVLNISEPKTGGWLRDFRFLNDGRLIGWSGAGRVCEYSKQDGSEKELFTVDTEGGINDMAVTDQYLFAQGTSAIYTYHLGEEKLVETDQVLTDFFAAQNLFISNGSEGSSTYLMIPGEDNSIYIACKSGLYRYIIGGTVMEQLIDGNLCGLSDPSKDLVGMLAKENGEFLILYTDGVMMKYVYDANTPTVPSTQLAVYSLEDNDTMRSAIQEFQKTNRDIYISYEIGMTGDDGVTYEDAIKNLNTRLMAGEGPDILLLDGLRQKTYEDKGILLDLSSYVNEMQDDLFMNIAGGLKSDSGIYAIPTKFAIPIIYGNPDSVNQVNDLKSMATLIQKEQEAGTSKRIIGSKDEEHLLELLAMSCTPAWQTDGQLQKDKIKEFITQAKTIYQAEQSTWEPENEEDVNWRNEDYSYIEMQEYHDALLTAGINDMGYLAGDQSILCGYLDDMNWDYSSLISVIARVPDTDYRLWNLQTENCFAPKGVIAVNAQTAYQEKAIEFVKLMLSETIQDIDLSDGIPVNRKSFEKRTVCPYDDSEASSVGMVMVGMVMVGDNGSETAVSLDIIWPTEADFSRLQGMIEQATTSNAIDTMFMDTVLELAPAALRGEKEIDEVVDEINNRMQIRMAE